ncbi:hypothetical protein [Streptomyces sp. NBC_01104]|uniref:hypothetical protein n=1 Tax=Streptomyces sp. NBC_01104 TaxID=2903750 RepID=UPI003868A688|nr:hypothetical protein OG450_14000 [Streptomyces sp. NBC_01104]
MISEPEMTGGFDAPDDREVLDLAAPPPADRAPRTPRRWAKGLWALGGAVVASALWATAFVVYAPADRTPDLHGYRLDRDPCPDIRLKSIGAAIAPREPEDPIDSRMLRHAALDRTHCLISLRPEGGEAQEDEGWSLHYSVAITIALHKETDPRAEFEAGRNETELGVDPQTEVEEVPDLGDRAYLLSMEDDACELRVLEGGAVLSLRLAAYASYNDDGNGPPMSGGDEEVPDLAPYQPAMISDMHDLMAGLKG